MELGLGETDAHIYLASVRIGACSINQLSSKTGINRVTTHDSVGRLIEKWLLLNSFAGKRRLIYPQQIHHLQSLVDQQKTKIEQMQLQVNQVIGQLQSVYSLSEFLPRVRVSKGREWIQDMLAEIKHDAPNNLNIICDSWHFDELLNVHFMDRMRWIQWTISMIIPTGFEHFIFSAIAKNLPIKAQSLQEDIIWSWGMTLWSNKVALHAYEWIYITTTIIENKAIATMMDGIYQGFSRLTS